MQADFAASPSPLRRQLFLILAVLAAFAAASLFRSLAIEPSYAGPACRAGEPPWWCVPRALVLWVLFYGLFGIAALGAAFAALWTRRTGPAATAVGLGLIAVVNYNIDEGMIAAALGLLIWVRGRPSPRDP